MQPIQSSTHKQNAGSHDDDLQVIEGHRSTPPLSRAESNKEKMLNDPQTAKSSDFQRGIRFWCIIAGLSVTSLQGSLENSVVVTAGPAIVDDLAMGEEYIWITNAFFLCCAAVQPLYGQLCNIFGRRWLMLSATALFTLGSGICGGAINSGMLIAGRGIQGAGSGGMVMISGIIIGDLVPLRQRGYYLAIVMISYTVGMTAGPIVGGAVVDSGSWRWVFYLNVPIGGVALMLLFLYLHVNYDKEMKLSQKMKRVDYVGNGLLMAGTISMLYALTYAGVRSSWGTWTTLVPFCLGLFGLLLFALWESYGKAPEPVMPPRLFRHRTSKIIAVNTFLHWMLVYWGMYFLPLYFQAVLLYTARHTGVALLPMTILSIPSCAIAAALVSYWGRFKWLLTAGEVVFTLGLGLLSTQRQSTTTAEWATFQCVCAIGGGIVLETLLPGFQAPVDEEDQAAATSTWAFIRTVGGIWGVAVPATILNNRIQALSSTISDPSAREAFRAGGAYEHASAAFIHRFPEPTVSEIRHIYQEALRVIFLVAVSIGCFACGLFLCQEDVPLRQHLETKYGLAEEKVEETQMKQKEKKTEAERAAAAAERESESLGGEEGKSAVNGGVVEV